MKLSHSNIKIPLSDTVAKICENNPQATENAEKTYLFFEKLNLKSVWENIEKILRAFNDPLLRITDDFLSGAERLRFGNKLIAFLNQTSGERGDTNIYDEKQKDMAGIEKQLGTYSHAKIVNGKTVFNQNGEDRFKSDLRKLNIITNTGRFDE